MAIKSGANFVAEDNKGVAFVLITELTESHHPAPYKLLKNDTQWVSTPIIRQVMVIHIIQGHT